MSHEFNAIIDAGHGKRWVRAVVKRHRCPTLSRKPKHLADTLPSYLPDQRLKVAQVLCTANSDSIVVAHAKPRKWG